MKRLLVCLLVCALALTFVGCGENDAAVDSSENTVDQTEQTTVLPETEPTDPPAPEVDVKALFMTFLEEKAYLPSLDVWTYGSASEYTFLELDGDDVEELVLTGTDGSGFSNFAVFRYDAAAEEIRVVTVPNPTRGDGTAYNVGQYYGKMTYSPSRHAMVYTALNNGTMFGGRSYYTVADNQLTSDFSVSFERNMQTQEMSYSARENGEDTALSEDEYLGLANECVDVQWVALP